MIADKALLGLAVAALRSIRTIGAAHSAGYGLCSVEARALDSMGHPVSTRELADALQVLKQQRKP